MYNVNKQLKYSTSVAVHSTPQLGVPVGLTFSVD